MVAWYALALALTGCSGDCDDGQCVVAVSVSTPTIDECAGFCAVVEVTRPRGRPVRELELGLESDVDGPLFGSHMETDKDGIAEVCIVGPLTPGTHKVTAPPCAGCDSEEAVIDVEPFGAAYGLHREVGVLEEVPWVPEISTPQTEPILEPNPEGWDAIAAMAAAPVWFEGEQFVYYAGASDEAFAIGVAGRSDRSEPLQRIDGPLEELQQGEGSWNAFGQQAPHAMVVDGEIWLYYTGASLVDGGLNIGLATSSDGVSFVAHPDNPVLSPTEEIGDFDWRGVGHPSVILRDGVYEMWYASGTLAIGYALSTDGLNFERYCGNPILVGNGEDTWDAGQVKSPEVVFDGSMYWMTYSGCDPCFQVGFAASIDGLRWTLHPEPILPAGAFDWSSVATQSAFIEVDGDTWHYWYTGNDGAVQSLGMAQSPAPPSGL